MDWTCSSLFWVNVPRTSCHFLQNDFTTNLFILERNPTNEHEYKTMPPLRSNAAQERERQKQKKTFLTVFSGVVLGGCRENDEVALLYSTLRCAMSGSVQTDGRPDLNYNLVSQWEEGRLCIDVHEICMKAPTAVKIPLLRHRLCLHPVDTRRQTRLKGRNLLHSWKWQTSVCLCGTSCNFV